MVLLGIFGVLVVVLFQFTTKTPSQNDQLPLSPEDTKNWPKLEIEIQKDGTGSAVMKGDVVVMHYTGYLPDGTKFDSSVDKGVPFETQIGVGQVIRGWDEGVVGMKIGEKRKLTIPPHLGYGEQGFPPVIPPNSPLIFELELLDIKK